MAAPRRFYRGKKRLAKKAMSKYAWKYMSKYGVPKIGDITHDCDGRNHVINQVDYSWRAVDTKNTWVNHKAHKYDRNSIRQSRKTKILEIDCFYEEDNFVCGCHSHSSDFNFQKPLPKKQIYEYYKSLSRELCIQWEWWIVLKCRAAMNRGEDPWDDNGVFKEKFELLRKKYDYLSGEGR